MSKTIIKFLEDEYWATKTPHEIRVVPSAFRRIVQGITFYFPEENYTRTWDDFEEIQETVTNVSHASAKVKSYYSDYNHGYLKIVINIAHTQYSDEAIINVIKKTIKTIERRRLSSLACT